MAVIHARLANSVLLYVSILALWGFWRFFKKQGMDSSYWGAVVIAEVLVLLQGALGITLFIIGLTPGRGWVHILYGIVGAIALPGVYLYTKGRDDQRDILMYAVVFLFQAGVFMRAMVTGGTG
jgi:hypothetical protein